MRNVIIISDSRCYSTMELIVSTMKMLIISSNLKIAVLHYENWSDYIQLSNTFENSGSQFVRPVGNIIRFQFSALLVFPLNTHVFISCILLKIAALSNLASIRRYVLTPDIFETLRGLKARSGGEIQLADAINIHTQQGFVETVRLNGRRFDCGSVDGFMQASAHEYEQRLVI